jgi:glutaredoxin
MVYTIYIKTYCPSSQAAVKSAKATKEKCVIVDIEEYDTNISKVVSHLKKHGFIKSSTRHTTVPIVFHEGNYIGGNTELQQKLSM